ncbi:MAG: YdcH family protein [Hyphomonas sp.]
MTPSDKSRPSAMGQIAYIRALHAKISSLKQSIRDELKRPSPDWLRLSVLKKQKVRLKDKAHRFMLASADAPVSRPAHHKVLRS